MLCLAHSASAATITVPVTLNSNEGSVSGSGNAAQYSDSFTNSSLANFSMNLAVTITSLQGVVADVNGIGANGTALLTGAESVSVAFSATPVLGTINSLQIVSITLYDLTNAPFENASTSFGNFNGTAAPNTNSSFVVAGPVIDPGPFATTFTFSANVGSYSVAGFTAEFDVTPAPAAVPEPSTWLAILGVAGVLGVRRWRRSAVTA
ncbi:MAG: PEP-CTERM sorting domain-containing protein [Planctomycetaceae bacterium]|nr:PEP-CTERM sorting domain-containing protein [Planctomycetaceae bacterium]